MQPGLLSVQKQMESYAALSAASTRCDKNFVLDFTDLLITNHGDEIFEA